MRNPNAPNLPIHKRPGYEYLTCYLLGLVIQELTDEFCQKFLTPTNPNFRQIQQMTQAARSNPQCIAEGFTQESLKGYIYLTGISHGSNEELTKDFIRFLKKENLPIWPKVDLLNLPKYRKPSSLSPRSRQYASSVLQYGRISSQKTRGVFERKAPQ